MSRNYIDFISAYCDGWCERCAFTERCSNFAVQSAIGVCDGYFGAAIELAVGPAVEPGRERQKTIGERMMSFLMDHEPTGQELEQIGREMKERTQRLDRHRLAEASLDYMVASRRWLEAHESVADGAAPAVCEAIRVIRWDVHLIHVKIMRALTGRDEDPGGSLWDGSPVQNDWNGSAKVALISIERSERAWRVIAAETGDDAAAVLAGSLTTLRAGVSRDFPRAMEFRRPGFDG
jgi:hypothetical protein